MDIESVLNEIKRGFIDIQSVGNKTFELNELIKDRKFDILALAETWLSEFDTAKICEMTPDTHTFVSAPRMGRKGGGVGIFISNSFSKIKKEKSTYNESFEFVQVSFEQGGRKFLFIVVYRSPNVPTDIFMNDFRLYLENIDTVASSTFICGDFNFWFDDLGNRNANEFREMMEMFQFENKVREVTSITGHMLDLVFCNMEHSPVHDVCVEEENTISPVHKLVSFVIPFTIEVKQRKNITFRDKKNLMPDVVISKIIEKIEEKNVEFCLHNTQVKHCVICYTRIYNSISKAEYDVSCPIIEKEIIVKDRAPWFNSDIRIAKREKRRAEYIWRRRRSNSSRRAYTEAKNRYNSCMKRRKREFFTDKIKKSWK